MGEIIYFETCSGIWKIDGADGANQELLYTDDLCKEGPELSPDSRWAAYTVPEIGQEAPLSLWLLDIDEKEAWTVSTKVPAINHGWLPDNRLLYTEYPSFVFDPYGDDPPDYGTDYKTFIYDPATRAHIQIPAMPFGIEYYVYKFSPTEEKMVAVKEGEKNLLLINLDGSQPRLLIRNYPMQGFAWSPDGGRLAYVQGLYRPEIYVIDVASGHIRQLTHKDEERSIIIRNWSPDGKWIAFDQDLRLCVVHVKDGEEKCFDVRPTGAMDFPIAWSPDSSAVADVHRTSQEDNWDIYSIRITDGKVTRLTHDDIYEHFLLWR